MKITKSRLKQLIKEELEGPQVTELLKKLTGYAPKTNIKDGIKKFVDWYLSYYKTNK